MSRDERKYNYFVAYTSNDAIGNAFISSYKSSWGEDDIMESQEKLSKELNKCIAITNVIPLPIRVVTEDA